MESWNCSLESVVHCKGDNKWKLNPEESEMMTAGKILAPLGLLKRDWIKMET